ncbi:hypothetical protein PQU92_02365 [Asticcacaulis sp. BYS171W]|uniref:Uncharacterized protein n=1 Tax=Asticcacaulis aquaticus TaxID=2984212 RepID=A0ABT5HQK4_9CAUL|nr:hypothetical protein [Asticcacaulis aquaticus]MDC7682100.1 hypothetical protein [Asticcacaulis aquaticus]
MIELLTAAYVITGIEERPVELTGPAGPTTYTAIISKFMAIDGVTVRLETALDKCRDLTFTSTGYTLLPRTVEPQQPDLRGVLVARPPMAAEWPVAAIEHIQAAGCGKTYTLNFVTWRQANDPFVTVALAVPGNTLTQRDLQSRAEMTAVNLVQKSRREGKAIPDCNMVTLAYDSRVVSAPSAQTGQWSEIWSTYYCNARQEVELIFAPTDTTVEVSGRILSHTVKP